MRAAETLREAEMSEWWGRRGAAEDNQLTQSCSELLGIAEGLLADGELRDSEVHFLSKWLDKHGTISCTWPGDILHGRVRDVLADGVITPEERTYLVNTLTQIIGGKVEYAEEQCKVNELAFDEPMEMAIASSTFCLTGEFVFAPRSQCEIAVTSKGGIVLKSVTRKLQYLVVGGLGSDEWKHGSFGTKIAKAVELQRAGLPLRIVREESWANAMRLC